MSGKEFVVALEKLAGEGGDFQDGAKSVRNLLNLLSSTAVKRVEAADDNRSAVAITKSESNVLMAELDQASEDGAELQTKYSGLKKKKDQPKPDFLDWVASEHTAEGDSGGPATRFSGFLTSAGADALRTSLRSDPTAPAVLKAIEGAKSTVQDGLKQIDLVAAAITPGRGPVPSNFLEFLAVREGNDDAEAATIRHILSESEAKANILEGKAKLSEILDAIENDKTSSRTPQERQMLKGTANKLLTSYNTDPTGGQASGVQRIFSRLLSNPQKLTILAIIIAAGSIIGHFLVTGQLLMFSDHDVARGFITLLFAVGAIAIFLVITSAIVFDVNSNSKDVYERAKTILSMMLGIFGTVLGFYYGLPKDDESSGDFSVRPILVERAGDGSFNIATSIAGGKAPYSFFIAVADEEGNPIGDPIRPLVSDHGTLILAEPLNLNSEKNKGKKVKISIVATDSGGRSAKIASDPIEIKASSAETQQ